MRRAGVSWMALTLALAGSGGSAAAQTVISPDLGAARGLGTIVGQSGATYTIDGGTLAGANLFHSFERFSLGAGDTARWVRSSGDGAAVANVISRVTGGEASRISGTIDSQALPGAAFYFVNPAGVVFGPGARLDVPAAAHFSTAGELRFADGTAFATATPDGSTLSIAAPRSFGFLGGEGDIALAGLAETFAAPGAQLTFTGANVTVGDSALRFRGLTLAAVGDGAGELDFADPTAGASGGAIEVANSQLLALAEGAPGGGVRIAGAAVTLDATRITSDSGGDFRGGEVSLRARDTLTLSGVNLGASSRGAADGGDVTLEAGRIVGSAGSIFSVALGAGRGGDVSLTAGAISLDGNLAVASTSSAAGEGGAVRLAATESLDLNSASVTAFTFGPGQGGDVSLSAPALSMAGGAAVTGSVEGGRPGDVRLSGETIAVSGGGVLGSAPGAASDTGRLSIQATRSIEAVGVFMTAVTYSEGGAGEIALAAPQIFLQQANINSSSFGEGGVGTVSIRGERITLDETQIEAESYGAASIREGLIELVASGDLLVRLGRVSSTAYGAAGGGTIVARGANVTLDGAQIESNTLGEGSGGRVDVTASGALRIDNAVVSSNASAAGNAGDVSLRGATILLDTGARISSDTLGAGHAGAVRINGGAVRMLNGAAVTSQGVAGTGDAGSVEIAADSLTLADAFISSDAQSLGRAGAVTIRAGSVELDGGDREFTYISSDTLGLGAGGDVTLEARSVALRGRGYISSVTRGDAEAGNVSLKATTLTIQGGSYVSSDSLDGAGQAGDVTIAVDRLNLQGEAGRLSYISSDAFGGTAGTVSVEAKSIDVKGALISSDTYGGGRAGDVSVKTGQLSLDNAGIRSGTFSSGPAGNVAVIASGVSLDNAAAITSEAFPGASGAAGVVGVKADTLVLQGGAKVTTVSGNANRAGTVRLDVADLNLAGAGTQVTSENRAGDVAGGYAADAVGDAGDIGIVARRIRIADGARISTNSLFGAAGEIRIAMPTDALIVLEGADAPGSIQTSSGAGTGGRITIAAPRAIISNGGSILALGEQRGANVVIQSRYFINSADRTNVVAVDGEFVLAAGLYDVSSGTVNRNLSVVDASKVLRGQCPAVRSTGEVSQLITRPVGPYSRGAPAAAPQATSSPAPGEGACP